MRSEHITLLACPKCLRALRWTRQDQADVVKDGALECVACSVEYPVIGGVPRFVPRENYASGFGLEWTKHARTQYDSHSGIPATEQRFFGQTHWPRDMKGEVILEVGSGSGRFTEQAAQTGAMIVSLDYSYAVEANFASNGDKKNVLIVQADIFAMPFPPHSFDKLFCFGVLQHTPAPKEAFSKLPEMLKAGGTLCADIYMLGFFRTLMQTKYYVRPFARRMNPDRLYAVVCWWVDFMWPLAAQIRRLPKGANINWRLLVADYSFLGLQGQILKEWAYLDTFDMLAPRYDRPASKATFLRWADDAHLKNVDAEYTPHSVVMRAMR